MLFLGFFSCGFQLAFITAHFPAFIAEASSPIIQGSLISIVCNSVASLGALSIALIGLFNIVGSITAGAMGKHYTKKYLLSIIYTGRTIAAIAFIMLANYTNICCSFFNCYGLFVACHSPSYIWVNRLHLRS